MSAEKFRRIVLSMPEAIEASHMGHPDFRVNGRIFATLYERRGEGQWGVVKLNPTQQRRFVRDHPAMFEPVKGGWGRQGYTQVRLEAMDALAVRRAVRTAWENTAPKRMIQAHAEPTASRPRRKRTSR